MNNSSNHNAIDVMKFICAIMVVIIHAPPLLSYNETANFILVDILARIAVPFFFVCAGYLFFNKIEMKNSRVGNIISNIYLFKRYTLRLIKIYASWTVFYLIWWIPFWYHHGNITIANIKGYVLSIFISGSYYHLWYIVALIYGMFFTFFMLRHFHVWIVIATAIIFYLIGTFAYSYTWVASENSLIGFILRFYSYLGSISIGVFRAFPYLLMGFIFSKYRIKIKVSLSTILSILFLVLIGLEVWMLKTIGNSSKFSYVFSTGGAVFFIFHSVSKIKLEPKNLYPLLRKMSSIIYFAHPMLINICGLVTAHYFSSENSALLFISVIIYVMLFSIGMIKVSQFKRFDKIKYFY
jgi:serine/alanine racemase